MKNKIYFKQLAQELANAEITPQAAEIIAEKVHDYCRKQKGRYISKSWLQRYAMKIERQLAQAKLEILKWVIGITLAETGGCIATMLAVMQHYAN